MYHFSKENVLFVNIPPCGTGYTQVCPQPLKQQILPPRQPPFRLKAPHSSTQMPVPGFGQPKRLATKEQKLS